MNLLTASFLSKHKACSKQVEIFRKEWPNGATLTLKNALRAVELGLNLDWVAENLLPPKADAAYDKAWAKASAAYDKAMAEPYAAYAKAMAEPYAAYAKALAEPRAAHDKAMAKALLKELVKLKE